MKFNSAFVIAIASCVSMVHAGKWEHYSKNSTTVSSSTETDDCDSSTKTKIPSTKIPSGTSTIYSTSTETDDCDSSTKTKIPSTIPSTTFETSTIYSTSTETDDCDSSTKTTIPPPTSYSNSTSTFFSTLTSTIPCESCESETTSYTEITYTKTFITTEPCEPGSTSYVTLTSTFVTSEPYKTTSEYVTPPVAPYENKTTVPETIPGTVTPKTVFPETVPETVTPKTVFPETTVLPPYSNNTATTATNVESSKLYTITPITPTTPTPPTKIYQSTTEGGTVSLSIYVGEAVGKFTTGSSFAALIVMGALLL